MRVRKLVVTIAVLFAAVVSPGIAQDSPSAEPKVLSDGPGAKYNRVGNMHQVRYIEILLGGREAKTGNMVAACYNSMFTSKGIPASKDTAPQALVEGLDFDRIKEEHGVLSASLSGPKLWTPNWAEIDAGQERDFGGITAAWVAQSDLGTSTSVTEGMPYRSMTVARRGTAGWNMGTTVFLLDDPLGNTWIMREFHLGLTPQHTYDDFLASSGGTFRKLRKGWTVRVKKLEQDLIEKPEGGNATIMSDEFMNVYDKTGQGMTNYKP